MTSHWVFTELSNSQSPSWTWCRRPLNGAAETPSPPFAGFGKAVTDAVLHGFKPKEEAWSVTTLNGNTTVYNAEPPAAFSAIREKRGVPRVTQPPNTAKPPTRTQDKRKR
jgi:hypothetical protein